ncbi:MAG: patatin-like phospholipase family protein [Oligoflexales bacterium]|nr:patatin-like phospholipase family protein [Oligoflexales bacterium]
MAETEKFSILSLDGGGVRGIFSAAVLAALEEDFNVKIVDHFDLIAGTSTGGILALGLGLGLTPKQILEFYFNYSHKIFPRWRRAVPVGWIIGSRYRNGGLIASLKDVFGERKFGESSKRLLVTSYSLDDDDVYFFRTPHHPRLARDFKIEAWKVAASTSAAPGFFPAFRGLDRLRLVDGGVCANNPSMVALTEAVGTLEASFPSISLFSVGTTGPRLEYPSNLNCGAKLPWAPRVSNLFLNAQSCSAEHQVEFFLTKQRYLRANFVTPGSGLELDSVSNVDSLFAAARILSRKIGPEFKTRFLAHRAKPYVPLHKVGV